MVRYLLMTQNLDRLGGRIEQSLHDRFGIAFRCPIFCFDFVQICRPCIRLMSNKKDRNFYENGQFLPPLNWLFGSIFGLKSFKRREMIAGYYAYQAMIAHRWPSEPSVNSYQSKEIVETFLLRLVNWAHQGLSITLDKHAPISESERRISQTRTHCLRTRRIKSALLTSANQTMQWNRSLWRRYHDISKVTQTGEVDWL